MATLKRTLGNGKLSKENFPKEIASNRQIKQPTVAAKGDLVGKLKSKSKVKGK
jgi:hypothetical protein